MKVIFSSYMYMFVYIWCRLPLRRGNVGVCISIINCYAYLQRIASNLRRGNAEDMRLEKFVEALHNTSTGLAYPALTGIRKQSFEDVERFFFGEAVIRFMEKNNYNSEVKYTYLRMVRNWRWAVNERGLSDAHYQQYCIGFFDFLLADLISWYSSDQKYLCLMQVNR